MPASLETIFDFEFGTAPIVEYGDGKLLPAYSFSVVGLSAYRQVDLLLPGGVESFAVFFQPLAVWQLFRIPMDLLVNQQYDAYDVLRMEFRELWHQLAEAQVFPKRVAVIEQYLLRKAAASLNNTPVMKAALHLVHRRGVARIRDVVNQTSLSPRQFERTFVKEIGMSPKLYSRVARFQAVLDAKLHHPNIHWTALAYQFCYFDQMHMIKDFKNLSGLSPNGLLQRLGDMRPPALAASRQDHKVSFC